MTVRSAITSGLTCAAVVASFVLGAGMAPASASAAAPPSGVPVAREPSPSSDDPVTQARSLAGHGDVGDAIRVLEPYVGTHPRDIDSGRFLGDLLTRAADLASAERAYLAVLAIAPADRETHDRLGNLYAREDRLDDAIAQYEKTLPDTVAFTDLIRVHKRRGDLAAFVESFRREADTHPFDGGAQYDYGVILTKISKPSEALPYLEAAVHSNPKSCAALTALGDAFVDLGHSSDGVDSFERCLRIDPSDYGALVDLACEQIGRDDVRALEHLTRAVALFPNRPEAFIDLGYLDDYEGRPDAAIDQYDRAIAVDPFARNAYVDLGYNQLQRGRFAEAETTLLRGLSASNDDGRLEFVLAETFERLGKRDLARREYQSATHSDEPEIAQAAVKKLALFAP